MIKSSKGNLARALKKPFIVIDPDAPGAIDTAKAWIVEQQIRVLNVAGPRETTQPGVYDLTKPFLVKVLATSGGGGL